MGLRGNHWGAICLQARGLHPFRPRPVAELHEPGAAEPLMRIPFLCTPKERGRKRNAPRSVSARFFVGTVFLFIPMVGAVPTLINLSEGTALKHLRAGSDRSGPASDEKSCSKRLKGGQRVKNDPLQTRKTQRGGFRV